MHLAVHFVWIQFHIHNLSASKEKVTIKTAFYGITLFKYLLAKLYVHRHKNSFQYVNHSCICFENKYYTLQIPFSFIWFEILFQVFFKSRKKRLIWFLNSGLDFDWKFFSTLSVVGPLRIYADRWHFDKH